LLRLLGEIKEAEIREDKKMDEYYDYVRTCIACVHYRGASHGAEGDMISPAICLRRVTPTIDLVDGRVTSMAGDRLLCHAERYSDNETNCGKEGKFWEPKEQAK